MALKVTLNASEVKMVERVSEDRSKYDKKQGFKDYRRAKKQSARFIETNGLGGEVAVCKLFNLFPDLITNEVSDYDCTLHDGTKVEVKTTQYPHGKLIARHTKSSADIYVLVTGTMPDYTVVGYVDAATVKAGKTELNGKTAYIVEQKDFVPIEKLNPQNLHEDQRPSKKTEGSRRKPSASRSVSTRKSNKDENGKSGSRRSRSKDRRRRRRGSDTPN